MNKHIKRTILIVLLFLTLCNLNAANLKLKIQSTEDKLELIGVSVLILEENIGRYSNFEGQVEFKNLINKEYKLKLNYVGFEEKIVSIDLLNENIDTTIYMDESTSETELVIVETTRTYRSISSTPTRTEILTEEIDEAASMESSKISHLITHSTGVQVQTTSASSNGSVVRIQGLNGRYTQILKDGLPIYGGVSSSLDIMQIPPLDLKQVEFIKGSASTLYGGGAIGGVINLISKTPVNNENLIHLNISHIGSRDINTFFARTSGNVGVTALASVHRFVRYDADNDGFSDIPDISKVNINPKLFYKDGKSDIMLGFNYTKENRIGGDLKIIDGNLPNFSNFYYDKQNSSNITSLLNYKYNLSGNSFLYLKNSIKSNERILTIGINNIGLTSNFGGNEISSFSEFSYNYNSDKSNLILGFNYYSSDFDDYNLDSLTNLKQKSNTIGVFANYFLDFENDFSFESGLRVDNSNFGGLLGENNNNLFILPKLNLLYKINKEISLRTGGGLGYRLPTVFNEESESLGFYGIKELNFNNLIPEESYGFNFDINYQSNFDTYFLLLTLNQMFFYNQIKNPIVLTSEGNLFNYINSQDNLLSHGFESQLKFSFWDFTLFVGYTYNDSYLNDENKNQLILTPKHSIKGDLLFSIENKWRIGWDYEYKSSQLLSNGMTTRDLFTTGIIIERTINNYVLFFNAENITDVRQTRYSSIIGNQNKTPQFTEIWAPLDGFFINLGIKIRL